MLRIFNGDEEQCKVECGNDVECMVFTMPTLYVDYECRSSPSGSGPCCMLIYVDNAPREAPSNAICPNSGAGGYAGAPNSYKLWAKKSQIVPTASPTAEPTFSPTMGPSKSPSFSPTMSPSKSPTMNPSKSPTMNPSKSPSFPPTSSPSKCP